MSARNDAALIETIRELLAAYLRERNGLADLAENANEPGQIVEIYEQVAAMDEIIRRAENTLAEVEGRHF